MRYRPSSFLLGRDEIVRDKHQIALQSGLYHGSITHLKCSYGLATQMSVAITTSGLRTAHGLVIFVGSGLTTQTDPSLGRLNKLQQGDHVRGQFGLLFDFLYCEGKISPLAK